MKRSGRLIILVVVLVVLCGGAVLVTQLTKDSNTAEVQEDVTILTLDSDQVTELSWDYSEDLSFIHEGDTWTYTADPSFPLEEKHLNTIMRALSDLTAYKVIEDVSDYEQYGLEDPVCTVNVEGEQPTVLKFGNVSTDGEYVYMSMDNGNVYMVDISLLEDFEYSLYDLITMEEIPYMESINSADVQSETRTLDIVEKVNSGLAYSDNYIWFLDSDGAYTALDNDLTEEFIGTFENLEWQSCVAYDVTDFSQYGLENPAATVTISYESTTTEETGETDEDGNAVTETVRKEGTFVLELGDYIGESCYARIAGSSMVYLVDATVCDAALYTTVQDLLPQDVLVMNWAAVSSVDITVSGETYTFVREDAPEEETEEAEEAEETEDAESAEETDEDTGTVSEVESQYIWLVDGKEADGWSIWNALDAMESTGSGTDLTPERAEEISFVIHQENENFPEVDLAFYQYDSTNCLVSLNGETRLFVDRTSVVDLVELVNGIVLDLD